MMKPSRFNHLVSFSRGVELLFNSFSKQLAVLRGARAKQVRALLSHPDTAGHDQAARQCWRELVAHGYLVEDALDERGVYMHERLEAEASSRHLGLTVAPTLACNMCCVYCYQKPNPVPMTRQVEDALIRFFARESVSGGSAAVTWFGGEPLLRFGTIRRLSQAFLGIARSRKISYSAFLVTNGYLLDGDVARRLVRLGVQRAQVTLDGPPEVHDQRRPDRSGAGTFERIWANVQAASRYLSISLRVNVDQTNADGIRPLLERIQESGLARRIDVYLGQTFPYTDACSDIAEQCLDRADFSRLSLETAWEMVCRGFRSSGSSRLPQRRLTVCMAERANSFVVTPSGGVVKCWNEIDDPESCVDHLLRPRDASHQAAASRWKLRDLAEESCADCSLLPICAGGCPYVARRTGKPACHQWRAELDRSLSLYYYLRVRSRESEIAGRFGALVDAVRGLAGIDAESGNRGAVEASGAQGSESLGRHS